MLLIMLLIIRTDQFSLHNYKMHKSEIEDELMVKEGDVKEISSKLSEMILKQINQQKLHEDQIDLQLFIEQISQNLLIKALIGDQQVLQTLKDWFSSKCPEQLAQSGTQVELLSFFCQNGITQQLSKQIELEVCKSIKFEALSEYEQKEPAVFCKVSSQMSMDQNQSFAVNNEQINKIQDQSESELIESIEQEKGNSDQSFSSKKPQRQSSLLDISQLELFPQQKAYQNLNEQISKNINLQVERTPADTKDRQYEEEANFEEFEQTLKMQSQQIESESKEYQIKISEYFDDQQDENFSTIKMNALTHGHFLFGDQVQKLLDVVQHRNQLYIVVQWKNRQKGIELTNTILPARTLKQHVPHQLMTFYEHLFPKLGR